MMGLSYTLLKGWDEVGVAASARPSAAFDGPAALIESTGSMTLLLEEALNARVEAEVRKAGVISLDKETSGYLGVGAGSEALEREAVLTSGARRLVYARSVVSVPETDPRLLKSLAEETREPIGRIVASLDAELAKERLERAVLKCEGAAKEFMLDKSAELPARRYILTGRGVRFRAAVLEIFNPALLPQIGAGRS